MANTAPRRAPMTPERIKAREDFTDAVNQEMLKNGGNYDKAWNTCKKETAVHFYNTAFVPNTVAAMPNPLAATVPSNAAAKNINGVLISDIEDYHLPYDATQDEAKAAKSVGSKDVQKIFDALVKNYGRKNSLTTENAAFYCMGRFSKLTALGATVKAPKVHSSEGTSSAA